MNNNMFRRLLTLNRLIRPIYTQTTVTAAATEQPFNMMIQNRDPWAGVPLGPPDAILGITEAFKADQSPDKINLGVGAYRDNQGRPYVLEAVKKAEQLIPLKFPEKEYAGIGGLPDFCALSAQLAFGLDCKALKENKVIEMMFS